jgi:anti-anti-sigma factor
MDLTAQQIDQTTIVSIRGSVDALTADDLTSFLETQLRNNQKQLVIDLSRVDFVSSSGLRSILIVLKQSRQEKGDLRLAAAQPGVENVLEMAGFTRILKTYATVEEAAASFDS